MYTFIFRADDFGLSHAYDVGLAYTTQVGLIHNIGLMVNLPDCKLDFPLIKDEYIENRHLDLGLHFNLCIGYALSGVSSLTDAEGMFHSSSKIRKEIKEGKDPFELDAVYQEAKAQIEAYIRLVKTKPDYIDYHAIITPTIEQALHKICQEYKIKTEAFYQQDPRWYEISVEDRKGFFASKKPLVDYFKSLGLEEEKPHVFIFHPGFLDQTIFDRSSMTTMRVQDAALLKDEEVLAWLKENAKVVAYHEI